MSQLPYDDYEAQYQYNLQNQQPIQDVIVENDLVSAYTKKLINTTRTAEEKLALVEKHKLQKELDITGYLQGSIESMSDADSGYFTDINGQRQAFRFADFNPIDAIDKENARLASDYKSRLQPSQVSSLTGKPIDQLTEQDFVNVANYQYEQIQGSLSNRDYQFSPYNPDQLYNTPAQEQSQIPFAYKVIGKDAYDRLLIEAINPETGRQVTFDMSTNPYLNSSFDVYKSIETKGNQTRLEQYQARHGEQLQRISDAFDGDGRVAESVDIAQSTAYQTAARLLQYGPDFLVDNEKWSRIANAQTGQALADAWAGVKSSTRRDFANNMTDASDAWDRGDYVDAILGWGSQMDRLFAESATQMGLMIAGTVAVSAAVAASGGGALVGGAALAARLGGAFLGASLAGIDKTLSTIEEYKANNRGETMDAGQIAEAFALNTATLIPEAFLLGVNFSSFLPKSVASKLSSAYVSGAAMSRLGAVGTSIVGEAFQEGLEGAVERYLAQDQQNPKAFTDYLFSNDTAKEAVIGGMMGGALSGLGAGVTAPFAFRSEARTNNDIRANREYTSSHTNTGSENVDTDLSSRILANLPKIQLNNPTDIVGVKKIISVLDTMLAAPNLTIDTLEAINQKRADVIKSSVLELDTRDSANRDALLKALGKTKEEVFQEQVFFSDLNADKQLQRDGKRINDERKAEVKKELLDVAPRLGLSKEQAQKSISEVRNDTRFGWRGYNTYNDQIKIVNSLLNNKVLSKEERAKLEESRQAYGFRLTELYSNQLSKLAQFAEHAERIASGTVRESRFRYKSDQGGFNLIGEHLANNTYESGYSAYGVVQTIDKDIKDMSNMLKSLPDGVLNSVKDYYSKKFNIQEEKANKLLQRFKDAATIIRERSKQETKQKSKSEYTNREVLTKLKDLAEDKAKPSVVQQIRNVPKEQLESIKKEISSNDKFKTESKDRLLKTLEHIEDLETTTSTELEDLNKRNQEVYTNAVEAKKSITDTIITSLDNVKDAVELQNKISSIARPLSIIKTEEAKALTEEYRELYRKVVIKYKELTDKETSTSKEGIIPLGTKASPIQIYSDGSDIKGTGQIGYGAVFVHNGKDYYISGTENSDSVKGMQKMFPNAKFSNPTMEMLALTSILEKIASLGIAEHIQINQDYKGAVNYNELWNYSEGSAQREPKPWKAKEEYIKHLVDRSVKAIKQIEFNNGSVKLNWVKGHQKAGSEQAKMNDLADKYAKSREISDNVSDAYKSIEIIQDTPIKIEDTKDTIKSALANDVVSSTDNVLDTLIAKGVKKFKQIGDIGVDYVQVPVNSMKHIAVSSAKGILLQENITINNFVSTANKEREVVFSTLNKKYNINIDSIINNMDNNTLESFILLHEYRHTQQEAKRKSRSEFLNDYKKDPLKFELDATDFAIRELGLTEQKEVSEDIIDVKDYASSKLLDGNINYSATFAPFGWNSKTKGVFDIKDELKVTKDPSSTFAINGIQEADKPYLARVLSKMKPIFLTLKRTEDGSPIGNQMSYFTKSKGKIGGMWDNAPHLRILYNFITQDQDSTLGKNDIRFEPNEAVAATVDLSLKEFFSSMNVKDVFNPRTRYDLGKLYGINEATMTDEQYQQLKAVVKQYGIPEVVLADRLGQLILDNLGIQANKNGTVGFYEKTTTGLGLFALSYARELGFVSKDSFNPDAWKKEHNGREHILRNNIPHIKFDTTKIKSIRDEFLGKDKKGGLDKYKLKNTLDSAPRTAPAPLPNDMKIKGTRNLINIPSFTKKVMSKLWRTPYVINLELAELVAQNKEAIKARLGYLDNIEDSGLSFDERESFEGVNASIDSEIEHLLEAAAIQQEHGNKWYFNWFMSKNGRLFQDSNTLNPQSGKAIQRFLALPEKMYRDFDVNNEAHMKSMYFAIAQAFDSVLTDAQIETIGKAVVEQDTKAMLNDLIHMEERAFLKKYEHTGIDGIENFGHAMNVLQHINVMKEANGKPFKTWLAVENDSTTSGYFIRFLQFPDPAVVDTFGEKVGILREDSNTEQTEIHNLKRTKGFLDIYKTMAKNMSELLPKSEADITEFFNRNTKRRLDLKVLMNTFKMMNDALPKPDADGNVNSALRKLLKSPAMTFGYTAGKKSISDNLAREIMSEFIHVYMDIKKSNSLDEYLADVKESDKVKVRAIFNTLEHINQYYKGDLYTALGTNSVADIKLVVNNKYTTLDRYFNEVLAPTYGEAVWNSLEKSFAPYIEYNNSMNQMFVHMFQMFETELEKKMDVLRNDYPFGIPKAKEQEAVESLFNIFPAMRLAYSNSIEEGMLLMNTQKLRSDSTSVMSPITTKDGRTENTTGYANVRQFINSGKAGAVLPIHFIDGMGMAMVLNKFSDVIPVHDAIVMSALDNQTITQEYNRVMTLLSKEQKYDVYGTLVDRYIEVINNFNKMNNEDNLVFAQQLEDAYGVKSDGTVQDFIDNILELNARNQMNRQNFYSSPLFISNMDGLEGSGVTVNPTDTLEDKAFKDALENWHNYSDPNNYRTDNDIRQTLQQAQTSVEGRIKLFDDLQQLAKDLGNKVENSQHLQYLKDLVGRVNPEYLNKLMVEYSKTQEYTVGMLKEDTITIGFDSKIGELDEVTRLSPFSHKSAAEIYAHEIVHAGLRLGIASKDAFKLNKEVHQLMKLQKEAMKIITWEDFMPTTYDSKLQSVYEANAKKIWNYIFDNPNVTELQGLHEFTAYGLTNEKMMKKLQDHHLVNKSEYGNAKLLDKIVALAKSILDVVFGKERFSSSFDLAHEILKGNVPIRYRKTMFQELERLTNKINYANTKAGNQLFHHPLKAIENLFKIVGNIRIKGNEILSPKIKYVANLADNLGLAQGWYADVDGSWFDSLKLLGNLFVLSPFSDSRRKALNVWLKDVAQLSQQGVIQTVLREVQTPDIQTSRLMIISALTRTVDQTSKGLESTVYADMLDRFGKTSLTNEETTALTRSALFTDLSSLMNEEGNNIEDIKKLLSDKEHLASEISNLVKELDNTGHGTWYKNQALGLAYFMTTGVGNEAQNLNAKNIAEGRLTGKIIKTNDKVISSIDRLATLYALQMTEENDRLVLANLSSKGLSNFLTTHRNFVKETINGVETTDVDGNKIVVNTLEDIHAIKGYTKQLLDTSVDIKVDMQSKSRELARAGYKLVKKLGVNEITGVSELALYKRTYTTPSRRDGAGFILTGANTIGTTLKESAYQTYENIDPNASIEDVRKLQEVYYSNAEKVSNQLMNLMQNGEVTIEQIKKLSKGYTPVVSPNGGIADFRITMSHATKVEHLGMNLDGLNLLSKMYATQNTKLNASTRNKVLVEFLRNDMLTNMNTPSYQDLEGHKYIKLDKNTDNKFLKDAWSFIPKELMTEIKKGDFYVREDWLQDLFGVPSTSIVKNQFVDRHSATIVKRALTIGEFVLKHIAYMAKQNIVIRVPAVLAGNIMSNLNLSIANGSNPATVVKKTIDNARSIRDYIDNKKELNRIEFRQRLGTATQQELSQINWYKAKLEHNPVHPLMQKGMYQAIVEDINPDELESIGKINQVLKNSKIVKKIPSPIRWVARQLYMTEGTAYFDFMFQVTQYSDFVSRATEYQLRMAKAPEQYTYTEENGVKKRTLNDEYIKYEEAVTIDVWNAFINYDKPQSSVEQYLNDIGLIMFTKFAKRIQHQITKGVVNNPMGVLMFMLAQHAVVNTEDIYEQNIFNKTWSALIHNPMDNLTNAITPMPLQYYFGMRNLGL